MWTVQTTTLKVVVCNYITSLLNVKQFWNFTVQYFDVRKEKYVNYKWNLKNCLKIQVLESYQQKNKKLWHK